MVNIRGTAVSLTHLNVIDIKTECFVYHFNVQHIENFQTVNVFTRLVK